jgi:Root hair defective 3 GTP-binding protein (RHD3)
MRSGLGRIRGESEPPTRGDQYCPGARRINENVDIRSYGWVFGYCAVRYLLTSWTSARYDRDPSRYQPDLYQRNREDLLAKMRSTLSFLAVNQFKLLHKDYLEAFEQELVARMSQDECHFADLVSEMRHRWENKYEKSAREVSVEGTEPKWKHELSLLKADIRKLVDRIREDETIKVS